MRLLIFITIVFMYSCGGTDQLESFDNTDNNGHNSEGSEYKMNEQKLDAVSFNNELTLIQEALLNQVDNVFTSDSASVKLNLDNALFEIILKGEYLGRMNPPAGGEEFLNQMIELTAFYRNEFEVNFPKLVPLIQKKELSVHEQRELDAYDLNFARKEEIQFDTLFDAQTAFSLANKMRLEERK